MTTQVIFWDERLSKEIPDNSCEGLRENLTVADDGEKTFVLRRGVGWDTAVGEDPEGNLFFRVNYLEYYTNVWQWFVLFGGESVSGDRLGDDEIKEIRRSPSLSTERNR